MQRQERQERVFQEVSDVLFQVSQLEKDETSLADTMMGGMMAMATMIAAMQNEDMEPRIVKQAAISAAKLIDRMTSPEWSLEVGDHFEEVIGSWRAGGEKEHCEFWVAKIVEALRGEIEEPIHAVAVVTALLCHICSLVSAMCDGEDPDKAALLFEELTASINHHYPHIQIRLENPPL